MDDESELINQLRKIWTAKGICGAEQDEMLAITARKAKAGIHFDESHLSERTP
ncbi:hypothetical protein [Brucella pseudogrignonensis]|uniref:Uncharacterized protein n=1 Tax=Brucella pseudogrignonensis TaxID=419475 RepID=A0ABU1MF19_9HYPH|nr:hypothetical protein [Brucella pseudogrignonensis]MDR6434650.1 hypothetical protein [Brucella pseudogrignonensis]